MGLVELVTKRREPIGVKSYAVYLLPALALLLLWQLPGLALADTLRLKNGNVLEGTITQRDERQVTIELPDIGALAVDRADIAAIEEAKEADAPASGQAPAPAQPVSQDQLALFERTERDVRFWYPKGWHVQDRLDRHPYNVTVSPKPFDPSARNLVVVELTKYYHVSRTLGLKAANDAELAESFLRKFRERGAQILEQRPVQVQGVAGTRAEARAASTRAVSRLLIVAAAKDDTLAWLYAQAPAAEFEQYRGFFEAAAERLAPFASGTTDNERIDAESARRMAAAMQAVERGNADSAISRMQEALRINPGDAIMRVSYGSLLLDLGLQKRDPQLLARSEAELGQVIEWLEPLADPRQAPTLAQAYFILGELARQGGNQPDRAKRLYEKALAVHPAHEGAKRALGR